MTRRVVITGMGGVTAFGENWESVSKRLLTYENAVRKMPEYPRHGARLAIFHPSHRAGAGAGGID